jgi:hypothetical protein
MVFDSDCFQERSSRDSWRLIIQIRIKTSEIYFNQSQYDPVSPVLDPVQSFLTNLASQNQWRRGDAVFSSLNWSQIVLILSPRTLTEAFDFKHSLQGRPEVDRTQTTFARLISRDLHNPPDTEDGIRFVSALRLGDIPEQAYKALQQELWNSGNFLSVEEVPGIFDLQVTWKFTPVLQSIFDIFQMGEKVVNQCPIGRNFKRYPALVSDIQTTVTRQFNEKSDKTNM